MLSPGLIEQVTAAVAQHQYLIAVTTPLTIGEITMHAFGILYGSGKITIYPFLVGIVSIIALETVIYAVVQVLKRINVVPSCVTEWSFFKKLDKVLAVYGQQFSHRMYFLFIAMKVTPMTKGLVFLFALRYNIPIRSFFICDTVVTVFWTSILFIPGYFVGKNILTQETGLEIINTILYAIALIVVLVLFGNHIQRGVMSLIQRIVRRLDRSGH